MIYGCRISFTLQSTIVSPFAHWRLEFMIYSQIISILIFVSKMRVAKRDIVSLPVLSVKEHWNYSGTLQSFNKNVTRFHELIPPYPWQWPNKFQLIFNGEARICHTWNHCSLEIYIILILLAIIKGTHFLSKINKKKLGRAATSTSQCCLCRLLQCSNFVFL